MKIPILFCFLFFQNVSFTQPTTDLSFFEPLIGKVWVVDGQWGDGTPFKQEIIYEYDLDKKLSRLLRTVMLMRTGLLGGKEIMV